VVPPVPVLVLGLLLDEGVPEDPQPAASSKQAVAEATAMIDLLNSDLLNQGSTVLPQRPPAPIPPQPAWGTSVTTPPTGIAGRLALPAKTRKAVRDLLVMLMPN